jgi:hypothetical protein
MKGNRMNLTIKNTQGINIILDKITELNITSKIFEKINETKDFKVSAETINNLTRKSVQSNEGKEVSSI